MSMVIHFLNAGLWPWVFGLGSLFFATAIDLSMLNITGRSPKTKGLRPNRTLTKPSRNVILSQFLVRISKHLFSRVYLDQFAQQTEGRRIGYARCLLHVMRYYHDGVLLFEFYN